MMVSIKDMFTPFEIKMAVLCTLGALYAFYLWWDLRAMIKHSEDSQKKMRKK